MNTMKSFFPTSSGAASDSFAPSEMGFLKAREELTDFWTFSVKKGPPLRTFGRLGTPAASEQRLRTRTLQRSKHLTDEDFTHNMSTGKSTPVKPASPARKNAKWAERKQQIFVTACESVITEGHRREKCFSKHGWDRLVNLFNSTAAKNWSRTQLKNHWDSMRREHKHLHELLRCTGIEYVGIRSCPATSYAILFSFQYEYNQRDNVIAADDDWWERKIKEKAKYAKFRNRDVREIYHRYPILFGQAFDSDKYSMMPTKLSQRGFDGVINSGSDSPHDTLPIFAETRDSSDEGPIELGSSSRMDISGRHSGEKRKGSARRSKGKAKKCITELVATGKVPKDSALYNFALTFLVNRKNREGFAAAKEPEYKLGWIQYNFDQFNK
ncbi:L10-interacting MYB domain-containing protein [Abeliophyllum distichum]|uniref:L10-interacting MYB domain-containing protein n=1 Tax=Abeliophyllum distichum TaxID=126358 RepID=A0ABD1QYI4_9LAMI